MALQFKIVPVSPFQQNCRILWETGRPEAIVIDPGGDAALIQKQLVQSGLILSEIWLTHSHLDHCGGVQGLLKSASVKLLGHAEEREFRSRVVDVAQMYGIGSSGMENCPEPTQYLSGGEVVHFHEYDFKVLFTPGHSPGHLCFYCEEEGVLIAGDTLFCGSIGRTDLPGGDHKTLIRSIREKILVLPDETRVLSGHGPDTTVGEERESNPFL